MAMVKIRRVGRGREKDDKVVLSRKRYNQLMEDLHDLAVVAQRREESPLSAEEMTKRLHKSGLL